ncbi:DUF4296 domain-containing protein [Myroides fluvii]|uniref:DUF4296 domain-containing protein n=1 Tax=Myroides fluvii TaxID=2572594 RepID=UPI00131EC74A|nr:DUF4296 domain-containing protein [Myroides fluvii]
MKQVVVAFCMVLLLCSCAKDTTKPNPFIEQAKMEDILYDIALLYGMQTTNAFVTDTVKSIQVTDIFEKHQVDSLTFTTNNRYYVMLKKGVYLDMQNRVMDRLKKDKERIDSLLPAKNIELAPLEAMKVDNEMQETSNQMKEEVMVSTTNTTNKVALSSEKKVNMKEMTPEEKKNLRKKFDAMLK